MLRLFFILLLFSFVSVIAAWISGRQWGDLSSRRRYGEALTEDEMKTLRRSRRSCLLWLFASALLAVLAFYALG